MSNGNITGHDTATETSLLTEDDLYLFNQGTHCRMYDKLGAHLMKHNGAEGVYFAVWAPNAAHVSVMGSFNNWNKNGPRLKSRGQSGVWEGFVPGIKKGDAYKYHIASRYAGYQVDKADPYAFHCELSPRTASVVADLQYTWGDQEWMRERWRHNQHNSPISIYELHLGSWMRDPANTSRFLTYREIAPRLAEYVKRMGFTHVELLPIMEHPFYGSWGYQVTGYYAPTSRYGPPEDFMYLVDMLHRNGIAVILDWVPSHFATDEHGLAFFDGTHLYEHADSKKGFHPDWGSFIFNYGRHEVQSFLLSSAIFWLDKYHIDGLRVDAVASMLYLDYSRKEGEWIPNQYGGRENLEAISLLRRFNTETYKAYPDIQTFAEESTAWPMVSRPTYVGGLGFGMKWDMGWMHDMLLYMSKDPVFRKFHQNNLTFRLIYAFNENFVLPLSHDEVVLGKGSLIRQMPGDDWQRFANLRMLFGYMMGQPGKKLIFMGGEFGQWSEWYHETSLDWHLLQYPLHSGVQNFLRDVLRLYKNEPALHQLDFEQGGFEWIDFSDYEGSVVSFLRKGSATSDLFLVIANFTPVSREGYRVGVPRGGTWKEALNSNAAEYGGTGQGNLGAVHAQHGPCYNRPFCLTLTLPPLSILFFKHSGE